MPRKRSSSESSGSSVEYVSKRKNNRSRRRSSSSSSSSRSRTRKDRRRGRSSSSSGDSYKKSKKNSKSSKNIAHKSKNFDTDDEREKNFDFADGLNDLHKNDKLRQQAINKLDESGGFKPKSFKSSRSDRKRDEPSKFKSDLAHENAIFGNNTGGLAQSADILINPKIVSSSNKSIMSDLFFEDVKERQNRWKLKIVQILNKV